MHDVDLHYPRPEFAERTFMRLAKGPVPATRLFGPRRTGKTQFLLNDLAPLAEMEGHKVVYVDFWRGHNNPLAWLFHSFDIALRKGTIGGKLREMASKIPPGTLKLNVPGVGEVEMDMSIADNDDQERYMVLIDQYFERLANSKKKTFLIFDEFQEFTKLKNGESIIVTLRSNLVIWKAGFSVVFAGSSQEGLRQIFSKRDAPFYRFASSLELPPLDDGFVDHLVKVAMNLGNMVVCRNSAMEAFQKFNRNPMLFQQWIDLKLAQPSLSGKDLIDTVLSDLAEEYGYERMWRELTIEQRMVGRLLADRVPDMFGQGGRKYIENLTDHEAPTGLMLQFATRKLIRLEILDRLRGGCVIADPMLESWILNRPASDFLA